MFSERGLYEGDTKRVRTQNGEELHVRHGFGKYTYPSGSFSYEGDWVNGVKHGSATFLCSNGVRYVGEFYRGQMTGVGVRTWPDGSRYEGEFDQGEMQGQGKFVRSDCDEQYEGEWQSNQRAGYGELALSTGDTYVGEFHANRRHGNGVYSWAGGCSYEGNWAHGKRTALGREVLVSGDVYNGSWEHDFKHGRGKWVSAQYQLEYDGPWDYGVPTGLPRSVCIRVVKPPEAAEETKKSKTGRPPSHSDGKKSSRKKKHQQEKQQQPLEVASPRISECVVSLAELPSAHPKMTPRTVGGRRLSGNTTPRVPGGASRPSTPAGPLELVYPRLNYAADVLTVKNADLVYENLIDVRVGSYFPPLFLCLCGEDGALVDSEVGRRVRIKLTVVNPDTLNFKVKKTKSSGSNKSKTASKRAEAEDDNDDEKGADKVYFCNCHNYPEGYSEGKQGSSSIATTPQMTTQKSVEGSQKKSSKSSKKDKEEEEEEGVDAAPCRGLCSGSLKGNGTKVVEIEKCFDGPVLFLDGLILAAGCSPGTVAKLEVEDATFSYSHDMCRMDKPHPASLSPKDAWVDVKRVGGVRHPASLPDPEVWTKTNSLVPPSPPTRRALVGAGAKTSALVEPTSPFVWPVTSSSFLFQAVDNTSDRKKKGGGRGGRGK